MSGSGLGIAVGIAVALWAGTSVFLAAQNAMNQLWNVAYTRRPGFLPRGCKRSACSPCSAAASCDNRLAGLGSFGASYGVAWKIGSIALSTALNIGLFWVGFRLLTARDMSWRSLRGGAIAAGIGYEILQAVGGFYVGHVLTSSSDTYGTFALVIGLLSFVYLGAHVTLLAAEATSSQHADYGQKSVGNRRADNGSRPTALTA